MRFPHIAAATVAVWLGAAAPGFAQAPGYAVAVTGRPAPGAEDGVVFGGVFGYGILNNDGLVHFSTSLAGPGVGSSNDAAMWLGRPRALHLVVRKGDPAPGAPGAGLLVYQADVSILNSAGSLAFQMGYGTHVNNTGVFLRGASGLEAVALVGMPAPSAGGAVFRSGGDPFVNTSGTVAFQASLSGPGGNFAGLGIFAGGPGNLRMLARTGTPAPGGGSFSTLSGPTINAAGTVLFNGQVTGPGVNSSNESAVWIGSAQTGSIDLVYREGNPIPSAPGLVFGHVDHDPTLNAAGTIAVTNSLVGPGVTSATDGALLIGRADDMRIVAREGDAVPGLPGLTIGERFPQITMNRRGEVPLNVYLTGPGVTSANRAALLVVSGEGVRVAARAGEPLSGVPAGVTLSDFGAGYDLNHYGQIAIRAVLGGVFSSATDRGVWATDPFGQLVKIAREGDAVQLAPGDVRTIAGSSGVEFYHDIGAEAGHRWGFNDAGQIATSLTFTDGTRAMYLSRVGGTARVTEAPPTFGPGVDNGFFLASPLSGFGTVGDVGGDIGYLKFTNPAGPGAPVVLNLDFDDASTQQGIADAMAELAAGAVLFQYTVTPLSGEFDAEIGFDPGGAAAAENFFYWNFANIDGLDLARVRLVPEPAGLALMGVIALAARCVARRRSGGDSRVGGALVGSRA